MIKTLPEPINSESHEQKIPSPGNAGSVLPRTICHLPVEHDFAQQHVFQSSDGFGVVN